jgi:hypothetical protein
MDLCQKAAFKIQDNQALQFTGNQFFNCGNALYKAGKRTEARLMLEKSLELDFSPIPGTTEESEEDKKKILTARCRKLEMLGECCVKGEEKVVLTLITLTVGCLCFNSGSVECTPRDYSFGNRLCCAAFGTANEEGGILD